MDSKLQTSRGLHPSEPLWKRAPARDARGRAYSDFIMLIPKLNRRVEAEVNARIARIHAVLEQYRHVVVFADLNLKINVLWISFEPVPGLTFELAAAIKLAVPEAMLVSEQPRQG